MLIKNILKFYLRKEITVLYTIAYFNDCIKYMDVNNTSDILKEQIKKQIKDLELLKTQSTKSIKKYKMAETLLCNKR